MRDNAEEFQIIYVDNSTLGVDYNSPCIKCGLHEITYCWRIQCIVEEENKNFTGKKPNTTSSSRWPRLTAVISHIKHLPLMRCDESSTLPLWSSSPKPLTSVCLGEKYQTSPSRWTFYKISDHFYFMLWKSSKIRKIWDTVTVVRNKRSPDS